MKTTSSPESYRYCMFFCSVRTRGNFSPARTVRSTTDPELSDLSFVRTNAPPLPGFTCWNSTTRQVWPSSSMWIPFRNWLVETTSATAREGSASAHFDELLGKARQHVQPVFADDPEVLDPDAADAGEVDPRLDRDAVPGLERVLRLGREPRRFVDVEADAVAEAVPEELAEVGGGDRLARERVRLDAGESRLDARDRALLRVEAYAVGLSQAVRQAAARRERPRAVAVVAVDAHTPVDRDQRPLLDQRVGWMRVGHRAARAGRDDAVEGEPVASVGMHEVLE